MNRPRRRVTTLQDDFSEVSTPSRRSSARSSTRSSARPSASRASEPRKGSKRRRGATEEEEEAEETFSNEEIAAPTKNATSKLTDDELQRKVKGLIRLALFSELKKVPIKREDIVKKVLVEHSRNFQEVFKQAQAQLQEIFGMELAELPTRDKRITIGTGPARRAQVSSNKTAGGSSKSYIVISTLSQDLKNSDLVKWHEQEPLMGLLTVILSLIYVNGQVLSDDQLNHYFRHLYLAERTNHEVFGNIDKQLASFVKHGYLDRQKTMNDPGSFTTDGELFEYRWGPRAKVEIGQNNVIEFIKVMYGLDAPADLMRQIERASGEDDEE